MIGAFLGISVGPRPAAGLSTSQLQRTISADHLGPVACTWGSPEPGSTALFTWERAEPIGVASSFAPDRAWMSIGAGATPDGPTSAAAAVGSMSTIVANPDAVTAWSDDLGYASLFSWSTSKGIAAVSTRPEILEDLARAVGIPLTRDSSIAAELAYMGWVTPSRTGWREISALRAGETITLRAGRVEIASDPAATSWPVEPAAEEPLESVVDRAEAALLSNVEALIGGPHAVVADLTAGRDSRMVVAALHALGVLDRITLQTIGDAQLADVRAARELAARLGAEHRHGFFYPLPEGSFATRFARHVNTTAGVSNVFNGLREPIAAVEHIRLSGLTGEVVRGWPTSVPTGRPAREVGDEIGRAFQAGRIDLLRPSAREEAEERLRVELFETGHDQLPGWYAAHRYYAEVRLRARLTRVDDFTAEVRGYPLYSRELIAAGMQLLWHHRDADIADLLIARLAPGLDDALVDGPANPAATPSPPGARPSGPTELSFMRAALQGQVEVRRTFFLSTAGQDSAAWEWIDRDAFAQAAESYAELSHPQNRLLHGAAGAVIWSSD